MYDDTPPHSSEVLPYRFSRKKLIMIFLKNAEFFALLGKSDTAEPYRSTVYQNQRRICRYVT